MSMDPYRPTDDLDLDNPYAAPKSSVQLEATDLHESLSIPCSIQTITRVTCSIFQNNMWRCLWVVWVVVGIQIGLGLLLRALMYGLLIAMPGERALIMAISGSLYLVSLIIQVWLLIGMMLGLLKIARGQPVSFDVLFSGGRYLLKTILALVVMIFLFLALFALLLVAAGVITLVFRNQTSIGVAFFIAADIAWIGSVFYMCARLCQYVFLVMDQDAGVLESIRLSWEITRGRGGTIILVYLSVVVFVIAGILALGVGLVIAIPFCCLLLVVSYLSLIGAAKPDEGTARPPMREWATNWDEEL
jgi:hypothetical protein